MQNSTVLNLLQVPFFALHKSSFQGGSGVSQRGSKRERDEDSAQDV